VVVEETAAVDVAVPAAMTLLDERRQAETRLLLLKLLPST
jgi:hypothetical protein